MTVVDFGEFVTLDFDDVGSYALSSQRHVSFCT